MLEHEVLHADVDVHRVQVAEGSVVLEREATAFGECGRNVHVARRVVVDVLAGNGNGAHLVVERTDNGVVGDGDVSVLDKELVYLRLELLCCSGLFCCGCCAS